MKRINLDKTDIYLMVLFILILLFSPILMASDQLGFSNKTKNIMGYPPFMKSIGAYLSPSAQTLYDEEQLPVLTVGTELFLLSSFCKQANEESSEYIQSYSFDPRFFIFEDQDKDSCLAEIHEAQLKWYMLESKEQAWEDVQTWEELSATELDDDAFLIPSGTLSHSPFTQGLKIPEAAIGKRIGFIYTPVSRTGIPNAGSPAKVWDIAYWFGQEKYQSPGSPTRANEGQKLEKIDLYESIGEVVPMFAQPKIENLVMKGTFLPNFQLTAEYDFISNSEDNSVLDVSRFWWGEAGTTETEAYFNNQVYQTANQSPVLTINDVAKVFAVSVLPIKKESGFYVVGEVESTTSNHSDNQFTQPPTIKELKFSSKLNIASTVSASYEFQKGFPEAEDHSEYTWHYMDRVGQSQILAQGTIVESGKVPTSPKLTIEQSGLTLGLDVRAKDQIHPIGESISITQKIETMELTAEPKTVTFTLNNTDPTAISIMAEYANGSSDVTAHGTWISNDEAIVLVDNKGNVSLNPNLKHDASGTITFSYLDKSVTVDIIVEALPPSISELKLVSILENGELAGFNNQGATYSYHDGGKLNSIDKSTYRWKIQNETTILGNGTVSNSGIIPFPSTSTPIFHAGKVVQLEVVPKDNFGREGEMAQVEAKLETIKGVEVEPSPLEMKTHSSQPLTAYALFSEGRRKIAPIGNTSYDGEWKTNSNLVSISYSGHVTTKGGTGDGIITYNYKEFTVDIPFTVVE